MTKCKTYHCQYSHQKLDIKNTNENAILDGPIDNSKPEAMYKSENAFMKESIIKVKALEDSNRELKETLKL